MLAVLLLIFFHSARVFDTGDFYVKNGSLSKGMDFFVGFISVWFMPLFFFIAGAAAYFALRKRTGKAFLSERAKRLLVPLAFGLVVISSLQVYIVYLQKPGNSASYLSFWKYQFSVAPLTQITAGRVDGALITAFTWEPAHLWFIMYLFIFCLLALPLMKSMAAGILRRPCERFALFCEKRRWGLFLVAVPMMLASCAGSVLPLELSRLLYVFPFLAGFMLYSQPGYGRALDRARLWAFVIAALTSLLLAGIVAVTDADTGGAGAPLWGIWLGLETWLWIMALVGYARKSLNFSNSTLTYANEGSYPFYILHQTVIVALALGVVEVGVPMMVRYLFLVVSAFIVTLVMYDILVRRWAPVRFLFGMRPRST